MIKTHKSLTFPFYLLSKAWDSLKTFTDPAAEGNPYVKNLPEDDQIKLLNFKFSRRLLKI